MDIKKSNRKEVKAASGNKASSPTPRAGSLSIRSISLPKGGGAIQGMGEKFAANPVTGTASMTVPIVTSSGRSDFGPELSLTYDSGNGNGAFGIGWNLSVPSITRKTGKGIPQYMDGNESDVFIFSDNEDLVPVLIKQGDKWVPESLPDRTIGMETYGIKRYRPRIEGLFARIERWTSKDTNESHWRCISKNNITTIYGRTASSRIEDPAAPTGASRIFNWLLCESYDDKGNAIFYEYKEENSVGIDLSQTNEKNRNTDTRSSNRYLKRIKYSNKVPVTTESQLPREFREDLSLRTDWLMEVVLDYGENHYRQMPSGPDDLPSVEADFNGTHDWSVRQDPFSRYLPGFEVRTYRLCRRILMFHHFPLELGTADYLVSSTEFTYRESPIASFITAITHSGHKRRSDGSYLVKPLPPLEFEYSEAIIQEDVQEVVEESLENLPQGVEGNLYQWADIDGEGIQGLLTRQGESWFYKKNISPLPVVGPGGQEKIVARFAPTRELAVIPSLGNVPGSNQQLLDLAEDGQLDAATFEGPTPGFYERTEEELWQPYRNFQSLPNISWDDPNLKFLDLTGDGHADVLITEDEAFMWYPSLAEEGFGDGKKIMQAGDEERGPKLVFADGTQSIYLADFSGDGLTDLVRVRMGEVCYWPNLGYGRFGHKVTMDNSPRFDIPGEFDQNRIRLADIDGSGATDIIYLKKDGVYIYYNQSGNRWSEAKKLRAFPPIDNLAAVTVTDLKGNGTACLVWSSPLPGNSSNPFRYIDLMGGQKPHLLIRQVNNLGAETRIHYATSTRFYLKDKMEGKPWITRLPFLVHIVEKVETYDHISGNRFVARYAYHHGYFDGDERQFRGFGMVEQWDTQEFSALTQSGQLPVGNNIDNASHIPPVLTRTWFHTGAFLQREHISDYFAGLEDSLDKGEYYREPGFTDEQARELLLDDTVLPKGLTPEEEKEACRALKGAMLRQEVYGLDGSAKEGHPYTVSEQNFSVRRLQPQAGNRHGVFITHARETLNYHYERNPADPRISHAIVLETDEWGNVLKEVETGYGRRQPDMTLEVSDRAKQTEVLVTYTEDSYTNSIETLVDDYRTPLPCESRSYQLTCYTATGRGGRFRADDFVQPDPAYPAGKKKILVSDGEVNYEDTPGAGKHHRLIEHIRTLYRPDDLGVAAGSATALLPLGTVGRLALPGDTFKLAFTPGLLSKIYRRPREGQPSENLLPTPGNVLPVDLAAGKVADRGGYVDLEGDGRWWIPSGREYYSADRNHTAAQELAQARQHFFFIQRYHDPFDKVSTLFNDSYDLLMKETRDPLDNRIKADNDYRVLQAWRVTDANGNLTEAVFDALGLMTATAFRGKATENLGDLLEGFDPDPLLADVQSFIANPVIQAGTILGKASNRTVYDLDRFRRTGQPPLAATVTRETHFFQSLPPHSPKYQFIFSYSDGFGREIQQKIGAEPGDAPQRLAPVALPGGDIKPGELVRDVQGKPMSEAAVQRWTGTGRTVFNNKGKPVKQYEPFFSSTHLYEREAEMTDTGVSPVIFYDPTGRKVVTLLPEATYVKEVFDSWSRKRYDENDTVTAHGTETGDPRTDPDIMGYVIEYFKTLPPTWQTWHVRRASGLLGATEQDAAQKTAQHADTPTTGYLDSLGREFMTRASNRYKDSGATVEETITARILLDIEGNCREMKDEIQKPDNSIEQRVVMRYGYDMLGTPVLHESMEAGRRWILEDVLGKPIRNWDSRDFNRRMTYDELRRPTGLYVSEGGPERLAEGQVYGESQGDAANHRTRLFKNFDSAGAVTHVAYDFKGNLLEKRRDMLPGYQTEVDWQANPAVNGGSFTESATYDALNRTSRITYPDGSIYNPTFNEANLLDKVEVRIRGAAAGTVFIENVDYDSKGRRTLIRYGNGVRTTYEYDSYTERLIRLRTTRPPITDAVASQLFTDVSVIQDIRYTYDPMGNITRIEDAALKTVIHNNKQVKPVNTFTYDALYRLIEATGREHKTQNTFDFTPSGGNFREFPFKGNRAHPNDLQALRNYTQRYRYDFAGNFDTMKHLADSGDWTRSYLYLENSLMEPEKRNNRLTRTEVGNGVAYTESYGYDAHGNMTAITHLPDMTWDSEDRLRQVDLGGGGRAYYVYDHEGRRIRKVVHTPGGVRKSERIYLGNVEYYREFNPAGTDPLQERETLHVMDDNRRIAMVDTGTIAAGVEVITPAAIQRYQLSNHLDSTSLELDHNSAMVTYEEYRPFGTTAFQAGRSAAEVATKRYRYTGKERDEESGFAYHGARYYAPWLGRWCSADPAGNTEGSNLYSYVSNRPLILNDPGGTQGEPPRLSLGDYRLRLDPAFQPQPPLTFPPSKLQLTLPPLTVPPLTPSSGNTQLSLAPPIIQKMNNWIDARIIHLNKSINAKKKEYKKKNWAFKPSVVSRLTKQIQQLESLKNNLDAALPAGASTGFSGASVLYMIAASDKLDQLLTLANVVANEAGNSSHDAKVGVAYAYINRVGGTVREPIKADKIDHYKVLDKRWQGYNNVEKLAFLAKFIPSLNAARQRLDDPNPTTNDPTGGATHWLSPIGLPKYDPSNGKHRRFRYSRSVGKAKNRAFPKTWGVKHGTQRAINLQKQGRLGPNFREVTIPNVKAEEFLFYRDVKYYGN